MATKILVIEDDVSIADVMYEALTRKGYAVTLCRDGEDGFFRVMSDIFDLVLLDVVLPGRSGLEILMALRRQNAHIPVLMLSTRNEVEDRVMALSLTADDYLGKPFALSEFLVRVQSLLRRGITKPAVKLCVGDLELDPVTREVSRAGRPIKLTLLEFEILQYMMQMRGRVVSRVMLAQDVWKDVNRATSLDNVIDVHVSRLRKKIDADKQRELLRTVRGIGFRLSEHDMDDIALSY